MNEIDLTMSEIDALINDKTTYEEIVENKNQPTNKEVTEKIQEVFYEDKTPV